jgi:hypothetical protein
MPGNTVLVVGAGFSKPLGGPLLSELLADDFLAKSRASSGYLAALRQLSQVAAPTGSPVSLEELFTRVWRAKSTRQPIAIDGRAWDSAEMYRQIELHLADACADIQLDRRYRVAKQYPMLMEGLHSTSKVLTVLSFNYDMVVERACDAAGLTYDYGAFTDLELDDASRKGTDVRILKLHGSANWGVCWGCRKAEKKNDVIVAYEDPYVPLRRRSCPYCDDRYLETGIVPPILVKAGEIQHLDDIWVDARKSLQRAERILSIGYSLPAGDAEANDLLAEAATTKLRKVVAVSGPRGAPEAYGRIFGSKLQDSKLYLEQFFDKLEAQMDGA